MLLECLHNSRDEPNLAWMKSPIITGSCPLPPSWCCTIAAPFCCCLLPTFLQTIHWNTPLCNDPWPCAIKHTQSQESKISKGYMECECFIPDRIDGIARDCFGLPFCAVRRDAYNFNFNVWACCWITGAQELTWYNLWRQERYISQIA